MKLLIFLLSLCVTSLEAGTITNWGAQLPTAAPASGDVILMQKGGVTYYFTPSQLSTFISTNISIGSLVTNANQFGASTALTLKNGVAVTNTALYGTTTNTSLSGTGYRELNTSSNGIVSVASPRTSVNLIQNGSFEVWDNGIGPSSTAIPSKWRYGGNESLERNGTNRLFGAYCLRFANIGGGGIIGEIYQNIALLTNAWTQGGSWNIGYWNGKTVTFSCWVFATNANRVKLVLNDDVTQNFSSYHPGTGGWQLLSVTKTMSAVSTAFQVAVFIEPGADTVYADVDGAMLTEGQSIGAFSDAPLVTDNASSDPGLLITTTFGGPIIAGGISMTTTGVSHGVTTYVSNSTFSSLGAISPIYGGLVMWAISDFDYNSFQLYGVIGTNNPTDTLPAILFTGAKKNTTEPQALAAAETVLQISNWETSLFTVMGSGNVGIGTVAPLDKLHVVGGIVQTNGGIWQTWSLGAPSAPATQGAVYWNDGTNICAVFRNAGGALSTNKLSMTAWP